ncbi:protein suppressor of variegation 3-7 isoform X2 [Drosophila teissieri]|uniref:protein suppressor of variegation 3-7 isoform X2 n=1 Tax=Drosophila teissieri TaxID=7243 RepID=UPI001CBA00BE|nr:protein suppressor of variegation 3-7 isoform X2 [Drosophila teissieri]
MWSTSNAYEKTTSENGDNEVHEANYIKEEDHIESERKSSLLIKRNNIALRRNQLPYSRPMPQNRQELVKSIEQDRELLAAYFKRLSSQREEVSLPDAAPPAADPPVPQRNSYDLFFESACISVKGLPPKLAAEAKSRISQIITEFEIRAISEMEEQERRMRVQTRMDSASGLVYEFRPCS